jgi:hypothetical protein
MDSEAVRRFYRKGIPFVWVGGRCPLCGKFSWIAISVRRYQADHNYEGRTVRCRCGMEFDL